MPKSLLKWLCHFARGVSPMSPPLPAHGPHLRCFFSRSWLRPCCPSRCSLVSWSSAARRWHFFFSCCSARWLSSLSACRSASCGQRGRGSEGSGMPQCPSLLS